MPPFIKLHSPLCDEIWVNPTLIRTFFKADGSNWTTVVLPGQVLSAISESPDQICAMCAGAVL